MYQLKISRYFFGLKLKLNLVSECNKIRTRDDHFPSFSKSLVDLIFEMGLGRIFDGTRI